VTGQVDEHGVVRPDLPGRPFRRTQDALPVGILIDSIQSERTRAAGAEIIISCNFFRLLMRKRSGRA
jgi:hypothetical protein